MTTILLEIYGDTIHNRILEYLLENQDLDFAVGDMAKDLDISKPKAYQIMYDFEEKDYIKKSRIIGKTQLYVLNKKNKRIQLLLRHFKQCLQLVVEEDAEVLTH